LSQSTNREFLSMTNDPRKYLRDMLDGAEFVVGALEDRVREDLDQDQLFRFAVERELITVGEALNQLHRVAPEIAERVDHWVDIIGFRNILVHGYDILELDVIWDVSKGDLPDLILTLRKLLAEQEQR